ncbi:NAD(P)-dependent oxidoreductase [Mesorhizobium sp. M1A.F.Ca.IN.020.06.1.1]|uniref:NAD-dependent epimerase/dehydratase family protein n=1 Tax=unclassified Mesorhizobium TaxID=325217 RepID=UPI000BAECE31|nr:MULTISPECIES: NAD(P)-dependent oxidoreductase [unclassified Mesorhizobium]PBB36546.1 dTDP-glucose 4,6-dehydratase [Mesorhizobium sp. WSM3882]RUV05941.1 NAD(P)-dependent oxidoreductase [Mesorhizobium sp. M1A.F.Ca.IN.020.03.2.1]RUV90321.1 NAD(P)-dependent oxidoreductase [Mesorhizobium sp. M1A.F.Ca.IN.020.32.1.1]RUW06801.1 NAD(P)-dependent oxidoreductase [Mesorhizobium sp. M1A.F.Ca.IN.022.05.2.1]RUW30464.1 NAD(P)-dependent oxidoreductase [Mesorhizobium sp. M1A.F.Ca.IN.020.06.1.1]
MGYRIFLAGGSGAIGRRLIPQLVAAGHQVAATTRRAEKAEELRAIGASPVVIDVFDAGDLLAAVAEVKPEVVIHQLTDLPAGLDPNKMGEAIIGNARVRDEGTRNLVEAAASAGARRLIAQSIAWAYAPGPEPHAETDPLDSGAEGGRGISVGGVIALERQVLEEPMTGIVLRYGHLYGPGTGAEIAADPADAAAYAALLAVERGAPGAFNIAEPNGHVATDKAVSELGWRPDFRLAV